MNTTVSSEPDVGHRRRVTVSLLIWGATDEQAEQAARRAGEGESRKRWDFVDIQRLAATICPIDVHDPKVIAADADAGWAYAVYRADG
jgi:hypothetical protein